MGCVYCGASLPAGAMFCGECGRVVQAAPVRPTAPSAGDTAVVQPIVAGERANASRVADPSGRRADDLVGDSVDRSAVPGAADGPAIAAEPYYLQFSTGEIVTVTGTGLIGRNPVPQPGEYFDHLVTIVDPGKSVSKTHLEFGQDVGSLWVSDRFSGNGSVLLEPGAAPRRCEPGRRYRVARGSRIDIAEQFVIVS